MNYEGEIKIEIDNSVRNLVSKYRELLTITDRMFNTGDPLWKTSNTEARKICDNILKVIGFDVEKYFIAFPYSDYFIYVRPNN